MAALRPRHHHVVREDAEYISIQSLFLSTHVHMSVSTQGGPLSQAIWVKCVQSTFKRKSHVHTMEATFCMTRRSLSTLPDVFASGLSCLSPACPPSLLIC